LRAIEASGRYHPWREGVLAIRAFAVADQYDRRCTGVFTALRSIFSDIDKRYISSPSRLCLGRLSEELLYTYGYSIGTKA
jgi:hypothetical protein